MSGTAGLHAFMHTLARCMAYLGGGVLVGLVVITCLSVLGRILNTLGHSADLKELIPPLADLLTRFGPIVGDFELVEAGVALAIMAFLPWCQINRAHATVELFTTRLPARVNGLLSLAWEVVFAAVLILIAWRLWAGTVDKMRYGETTFMLQFPVWWGYAACTAAAVIACLAALYMVWQRAADIATTAPETPPEESGGA